MLPLQNFASGVLAEIIRRQPASKGKTSFAWSVAVGPALARVTSVELADRVLRVHVRDARWAREVEDRDGSKAAELAVHPGQPGHVDMQDFRRALNVLPADQREALILVGAAGFSYEEAAAICDCAVGTIKSRVNRARTRLSELLSIDSADEFGPDQSTRAILTAGGRG